MLLFQENLRAAAGNPTGTLSSTLGGAVLAVSGIETMTGTLASALGNATMQVNATEIFTGSLIVTLSGATLAANGIETISGTLSKTLGAATLAITGIETISGSMASTLSPAVLAATGYGNQPVTGTMAVNLGAGGGTPLPRLLINTATGEVMVLSGSHYIRPNGDILFGVA